MISVNSAAKSIDLQNFKTAKQSQQNVSFKGDTETSKASDGLMSKGLANALKSVVIAGILATGVTGCGKPEETQKIGTQEEVRTELRTSEYGKDVEKALLKKEFGELISSTNTALNKKGMTVEEKKDLLTTRFNNVIDETSDILFNGSDENIKENIKLLKENSEKMANIMINDKMSTKDKAKEFIKLFNDNSNIKLPMAVTLALVIAGIGAWTRNWGADLASFLTAGLIISNTIGGIKENNQRAEDILTGMMDRIEQRMSVQK